MASEWKKVSLREAGVSLIDCVHKTPPASLTGYPYIAIPQLKNGRLDLSNVRLISPEHFIEWTKKANPQPYDVILSRRCNPGETAFVPSGVQAALGQNLVLLRSDGQKVFPPFLRWLVRSPHWWEQVGTFINVGAVFDSLKCADIPNFQLPIPPLDEQKAIAHILGTFDDKIELNQQMNRTLEAIARAIFKSWFIDFDPVRAKMDGRQPVGMDAETAALFPDEFEDSPLGQIPKGWRVAPLDQIADFLNGLALQKYPPDGDDYLPVIKIAELRKGITESSGKASHNINEKYIIQDGDVLFSWSGSLECVIWCGGKGALNQHLFKVTSKKHPKWFYYEWVKFHLPDFQATAASKATTMGHIQRHHLTAALVVVPPHDFIKAADKRIAPFLQKFIANNLESKALSSIRDTLLPKLLSGEIRVKDAEKVLEEVV
ncbi:restriction endonuclease subunit S [Limnospira fusiformis]|uniref:restriction endonuclease subunit S n=1 Tax=Limnospira fusiformis TaxID=54297 RepID=UPI002AA1A5EB|nr:restriction endonuclease subunit S [Limnospira fusiformis LS22]